MQRSAREFESEWQHHIVSIEAQLGLLDDKLKEPLPDVFRVTNSLANAMRELLHFSEPRNRLLK